VRFYRKSKKEIPNINPRVVSVRPKKKLTWEAKAGLRNGFKRDGRTECRPATTFVSGALVGQGADRVSVKVLTRLVVQAIFAQLQSCQPVRVQVYTHGKRYKNKHELDLGLTGA
jgi:hypothetical protein